MRVWVGDGVRVWCESMSFPKIYQGSIFAEHLQVTASRFVIMSWITLIKIQIHTVDNIATRKYENSSLDYWKSMKIHGPWEWEHVSLYTAITVR